jgi:hypothetical protein
LVDAITVEPRHRSGVPLALCAFGATTHVHEDLALRVFACRFLLLERMLRVKQTPVCLRRSLADLSRSLVVQDALMRMRHVAVALRKRRSMPSRQRR